MTISQTQRLQKDYLGQKVSLAYKTSLFQTRPKQGDGEHPSQKPLHFLWLGGFRSDMEGTKALALEHWAKEHQHSITRFDYSGHGHSSGDFNEGSISQWHEDAKAIFDACTHDQPAILIGSSMGAWIALLLSRAHIKEKGVADNRIKGMILIAPAPDFTQELMWPKFSEEIRQTIMEQGYYEAPNAYSDEPLRITKKLIEDGAQNCLLQNDIQTHCPVHIIQGVQDVDVPYAHAIRLLHQLNRDDVAMTLIKDGDHRLSRPQDLEMLERAYENMVKQVIEAE